MFVALCMWSLEIFRVWVSPCTCECRGLAAGRSPGFAQDAVTH